MLRRSFYASLVVMLAVATATCGLPRSTVQVANSPVQPGDQWHDALARAKAENKYILALVCDRANVGCQQAEQEMLKYDSGADVLRHEFAVVRIPEEGVTSRDSAIVAWYRKAVPTGRQYAWNQFPTMLFFAPSGRLVHRVSGARPASAFAELLRDARDSTKQYYVVLDRYERGGRHPAELRYLARNARTFGDTALARRVANDVLAQVSRERWFTKQDIEFLAAFSRRPEDVGFWTFHREGSRIDSVMLRPGYADAVVDNAIWIAEVEPMLLPRGKLVSVEPAWEDIEGVLAQKYGR